MRTPRHVFAGNVVRHRRATGSGGRHHLPPAGNGRHRQPAEASPTALRRGLASLAAILLLAIATFPVMNRSETPTNVNVVESLQQRSEAAQVASRSALREGTDQADAVPPESIALVPERSPAPELEPPPAPKEPADPPAAEDEPADAEAATADEQESEEADQPEEADQQDEAATDTQQANHEPKQAAPVGGLNQQQMDHAATIVAAGQRADLPNRAYVVAIATALQETYLRNLANPRVPDSFDHRNDGSGRDHDSVGLFQQRPSMGWGSVAQLMDPDYSATKFYESLARVSGWEDMAITRAAQAVQVSAFPDHYAKHEPLAREIVDALT